MKLELDMWRQLLYAYIKFQINISKDAEKGPETFKKIQNAQT